VDLINLCFWSRCSLLSLTSALVSFSCTGPVCIASCRRVSCQRFFQGRRCVRVCVCVCARVCMREKCGVCVCACERSVSGHKHTCTHERHKHTLVSTILHRFVCICAGSSASGPISLLQVRRATYTRICYLNLYAVI